MELANGSKVKSKYQGAISARLVTLDLVLSSVFYIPQLEMNTLPRSRSEEKRTTTIVSRTACTLINKDNINRCIEKIARGASNG